MSTSTLHVEMKEVFRNDSCSYTIHGTRLFIMLLDFSQYLVETLMAFCRQFSMVNGFLHRASKRITKRVTKQVYNKALTIF